MDEWVKFKKSFTQEQENAIWQYFIDHSRIESSTFMRITFGIRDVNDFWKRVHARYAGNYSRYNKLEKAQKQQKLAHAFNTLLSNYYTDLTSHIENHGTWYQKTILWLHQKTRTIVFGERPSTFQELKERIKTITTQKEGIEVA